MAPNRVKYGRLTGKSRAYGPLDVEFLLDGGKRGPLTAMRVSMKPDASHPPIRHARTAEFFLVVKGSMTAEINGRRRPFRRGDHAFLPSGTRHSFHAGARGVEVLSVFTPALDMSDPDIVAAG